MRIVTALFLAFAVHTTSAHAGVNGSIDLFPFGIDAAGNRTTPDFGACQVPETSLIGGLERVSFGVYARLSGATLAGISLAELYLQGLETGAPGQLPTGWLKNIIIPPEAFSVGVLSDPFTGNGETVRRWDVVVAAGGPDTCQSDPLVLLAIVDLFGFQFSRFGNNHYVSVAAAMPSNPPSMGCPYLQLCDSPVYTKICVSGGQLIINPADRSCTVAVEQATWSRVKSLYR